MKKELSKDEIKITESKIFELKEDDVTYSVKGRACIKGDKLLERYLYVDDVVIDNWRINKTKVKEEELPLWSAAELKDRMYKISNWYSKEKTSE